MLPWEKMTNSDFNTGNQERSCTLVHWFVFVPSQWLPGQSTPQSWVTSSGSYLRGDGRCAASRPKTGPSPSGGNGDFRVHKLHCEEILSWKPLWKPEWGPLSKYLRLRNELLDHLTSIMNETSLPTHLSVTHRTPVINLKFLQQTLTAKISPHVYWLTAISKECLYFGVSLGTFINVG